MHSNESMFGRLFDLDKRRVFKTTNSYDVHALDMFHLSGMQMIQDSVLRVPVYVNSRINS